MSTVVVLGAGATRGCGGPMTDEILPRAFEHRKQFQDEEAINLVEKFLVDQFGLAMDLAPDKGRYPGLPLLLSLLDTAIHRGDAFGSSWQVQEIRDVRLAFEKVVFEIIELLTATVEPHHDKLIQWLGESPTVVSLNYDLLADDALMRAGGGRFPNYGCDINGGNKDGHGTLLKIHGSLNWLYCSTCHHLEVVATGRAPVSENARRADRVLTDKVLCRARRGGRLCESLMHRVLITPSHMKDYRNPHIARVWQRAGNALRSAKKVVFIGYSLPWDDVDVIYLLKRALAHLPPDQIEVVEFACPPKAIDEHDAGQRYLALFGKVQWTSEGFGTWIGKKNV